MLDAIIQLTQPILCSTAKTIHKKKVVQSTQPILCSTAKTIHKKKGSSIQSFNRPNLFYAVQPKPSTKKKVVQSIAGFVKSQHATHTGIVYGFSKVECEELAEQLRNDYGLSAKHYHAGMDSQERSTTQEEWQSAGWGGHNVLKTNQLIASYMRSVVGSIGNQTNQERNRRDRDKCENK
jgi:superfamily II DNA helicase RecQ